MVPTTVIIEPIIWTTWSPVIEENPDEIRVANAVPIDEITPQKESPAAVMMVAKSEMIEEIPTPTRPRIACCRGVNRLLVR
jgi:hypothetical protein